jgi:hypothetical protein
MLFNFNKKFKKEDKSQYKTSECDESFHSLIEQEKKPIKRPNVNRLYMFLIFPILYLLVSIAMPMILLIIKVNKKLIFESDIKVENYTIANYFDLSLINSVIYKAYTCGSFISGFIIVLVLFLTLNQRFKVPEYQDNTIKLYMMLLFGLISNLFNLYRGFYDFIRINLPDLFINMSPEALFLSWIIFSIFFSIYSLSMIDLLRTQRINETSWYVYRIILVSFLSIITIVYTSFLLYKNNYVNKYTANNFIIENMSYVLGMFPYFIHTINALMMFCYYFEIKYLNTILSRNLDVDYLFEDEELKI